MREVSLLFYFSPYVPEGYIVKWMKTQLPDGEDIDAAEQAKLSQEHMQILALDSGQRVG